MKKRMTEQEVIDHLRSECAKHGRQRVIAKRLKISNGYLCDVLKGNKGIADSIAEGLGYKREVTFVRVQ